MMKKIFYTLIISSLVLISNGCTDESEDYEEYVFAVQLVDDKIKIQEYLDYHYKIWPEVEAGFQKAGYKNIRLYRFGNYISMIVQVPRGSDLGKMGRETELYHSRVKEWNTLMEAYQKGLPGTKKGDTWVAMDKIYEFNNNK